MSSWHYILLLIWAVDLAGYYSPSVSSTPILCKTFSHITHLTTCKIQPDLTTLPASFVRFSQYYLSCPAISHIMSNCFPHPLNFWGSATKATGGTWWWFWSRGMDSDKMECLTSNCWAREETAWPKPSGSAYISHRAGSPVTLPSPSRKGSPWIRKTRYMRGKTGWSDSLWREWRDFLVLKKIEKWTIVERRAWHQFQVYKRGFAIFFSMKLLWRVSPVSKPILP